MAKIKAGTYRFNDVLPMPNAAVAHVVNFNLFLGADNSVYGECSAISVAIKYGQYALIMYQLESLSPNPGFEVPDEYTVYDGERNGWKTDLYGDGIKTITVPYDQDVSDEFGVWFTANTKRDGAEPAATITYNGATIAALGGGQTATLKCAGMKMESDVVVDVAEQSGGDITVMPLTVTENGTYTAPDGVDGYSPVNVDVKAADERFKQLVEGTIAEVSDDTVTSIGRSAFQYCSELTSTDLPLATSVGDYAFYFCTKLTSINIPLATSVGDYAFNSCSELTSIDLPLATSIGSSAFSGCSKMTSINIPLVTSIDSGAFQNCSKLTSIDLPLMTSINRTMFSGCSKLSCVIIRAETVCALSNTNAFNNTPFASGKTGGTLLAPRALVEEYKVATNWSVVISQNANNRILPLEDYTVDGTITGEIDWDKLNGGN